MSAAVDLSKLPGWRDAPRVWRQVGPEQRVRVVDPDWLAEAINQDAARRTLEEYAVRSERRRQEEAERSALRRVKNWFELANSVASLPVEIDPFERTNAQDVIREIAKAHGVRVEDIKGPRRNVSLVAARQHAVHEVARLCAHLSLPMIGRIFGGRDHTTILHSIRIWPSKASALGIPCEPIIRGGSADG